MNYYERHIGDYLKDTAHLSLLEHGIYTRLLDVYYTRERAIPDDQVARLIGARSKDEKEALAVVLADFFLLEDFGWTQGRCEAEISRYQKKAAHNRIVGKLGGRPRKTVTQAEPTNNPGGFQTEPTNNPPQYPVTSNQYPVTKEEKSASAPTIPEIPESLMADFLKIRKAKKAPLTKTAIAGMQREAGKAGLTMTEAITACCEFGWQGFNAGWYAERQQVKKGAPTPESFKERDDRIARERWEQMTGEIHPDNHPKPTRQAGDVAPQFLEIAP